MNKSPSCFDSSAVCRCLLIHTKIVHVFWFALVDFLIKPKKQRHEARLILVQDLSRIRDIKGHGLRDVGRQYFARLLPGIGYHQHISKSNPTAELPNQALPLRQWLCWDKAILLKAGSFSHSLVSRECPARSYQCPILIISN